LIERSALDDLQLDHRRIEVEVRALLVRSVRGTLNPFAQYSGASALVASAVLQVTQNID
jgi:hypothetical protein